MSALAGPEKTPAGPARVSRGRHQTPQQVGPLGPVGPVGPAAAGWEPRSGPGKTSNPLYLSLWSYWSYWSYLVKQLSGALFLGEKGAFFSFFRELRNFWKQGGQTGPVGPAPVPAGGACARETLAAQCRPTAKLVASPPRQACLSGPLGAQSCGEAVNQGSNKWAGHLVSLAIRAVDLPRITAPSSNSPGLTRKKQSRRSPPSCARASPRPPALRLATQF